MWKELSRKFAVRNTAEWSPNALYWNAKDRTWGTLDVATTYERSEEASVDALLLKAWVTTIHSD